MDPRIREDDGSVAKLGTYLDQTHPFCFTPDNHHCSMNTEQSLPIMPVSEATPAERTAFYRNTYLHLALAILVFAGVCTLIAVSPLGQLLTNLLLATSFSWFLVLIAFMGVSYFAHNWARNDNSRALQYAGLGLYVLLEAVIFTPLLFFATYFASPSLLPTALFLTFFLFAGLSFLAFFGGVNYSFLGKFLTIGGFVALGLILASMLFGFSLGLWFSGAMIVFAGASILYETSNLQHEYHSQQYVAASLALFASVALLFWYILNFLMSLGRN
jgi:FtsH-binding integral membrane protein